MKLEDRIAEVRQRIIRSAPAGVERRAMPLEAEIRDGAQGDAFNFVGHASVFDQLSEDLGGWREKVAPGAFKRVLGDDVRFLVNHNPDLLLARTRNGTLRLKEDRTGLAVDADIAPTSVGQDLRILVERKDMTQMSIAFVVAEASWDDVDGQLIRTVERFEALYDVSAVTYPAFPQTDGQVASAPEAGEETEAPEAEEEPSDGAAGEERASEVQEEPEPAFGWKARERQRRAKLRQTAP